MLVWVTHFRSVFPIAECGIPVPQLGQQFYRDVLDLRKLRKIVLRSSPSRVGSAS